MPKPLPLALSVAAVVALGGVAVVQQSRISSLRGELDALRSEAAAMEASLDAERQKVDDLTLRNTAYKAEAEQLRQHHSDPASAVAANSSPSPTSKAQASAEPPSKEANGWAKMMDNMMKDPEMKKMMRGQQAMAIRGLYGDMTKELGLSPDQTERVMQILSERQADLQEKGMAIMQAGDAKSPEAQKAQQDVDTLQAKYTADLQKELGSHYADFQNFEKTVGDRAVVGQYQQQFAAAGQPLSEDQRSGLVKIMTEERANMPANPWAQGQTNVRGQLDALSSDEAMHTLLASQEDFNRRVAARAADVLSPEQATAFTDMQNRMMQMQQMGIKMGRSMFGKK